MKEKVGYLGLGVMGTPMVRNLLRAGYPVVAWNRTRSKAEALAAEGAEVAGTPAEAAREATVLIACLGDAAAVEEVVTGGGGLLEAVGPGQVFIDMTTNSPPVSIRLARLLEEKGAGMLDAPVSGGDVGAIEGTLSIMVGGEPELFRRCLPLLEVLGGRVTLMGETVGAGGYAKLANQIMVAIHLAAMGEALVFGAKAGLDLNKLVPALQAGWANSTVLGVKAPKVLERDFTPVGTVAVQHKDLSYITRSMDDLGISLPFSNQLREMYAELIEQDKAGIDQMALIHLFEDMADVEVKGR